MIPPFSSRSRAKRPVAREKAQTGSQAAAFAVWPQLLALRRTGCFADRSSRRRRRMTCHGSVCLKSGLAKGAGADRAHAQQKNPVRFPARARFVSFNFANSLIWGSASRARSARSTGWTRVGQTAEISEHGPAIVQRFDKARTDCNRFIVACQRFHRTPELPECHCSQHEALRVSRMNPPAVISPLRKHNPASARSGA